MNLWGTGRSQGKRTKLRECNRLDVMHQAARVEMLGHRFLVGAVGRDDAFGRNQPVVRWRGGVPDLQILRQQAGHDGRSRRAGSTLSLGIAFNERSERGVNGFSLPLWQWIEIGTVCVRRDYERGSPSSIYSQSLRDLSPNR